MPSLPAPSFVPVAPNSTPKRSRKGFTLLELIVVIVVIAVLALLAIPTFQAAITRAEDENTATTLAALVREATAIAAFRGDTVYLPSDYTEALADLPASGLGVQASGTWALKTGSLEYSDGTDTIHLAFAGGNSQAGLALQAGSGHCAMARVNEVGSAIERWVVQTDLGANCTGVTALTGESAASSTTYINPASTVAPNTPTNLSATAGNAEVDLDWTAPTGDAPVSGYRVYKDTVLYSTVAGTSATVSGLTNSQSYDFTVSAYNVYGESPQTSSESATPVLPVPNEPTGLGVTRGDSQVTVDWTAPASGPTPTSYTVSYNTSNTLVGATEQTGETGLSATISGLTNGTPDWVWVKAVLNTTESNDVGPESATPLGLPGTFTTAPSANATMDPYARVLVHQGGMPSNGGDVTTTQIGTCTSSNGGTTRTATTYYTGSVAVENLTPGKLYTCTFHLHNSVGDGGASPASTEFEIPSAYRSSLTGWSGLFDDAGVPGDCSNACDNNESTSSSQTKQAYRTGNIFTGYTYYSAYINHSAYAYLTAGKTIRPGGLTLRYDATPGITYSYNVYGILTTGGIMSLKTGTLPAVTSPTNTYIPLTLPANTRFKGIQVQVQGSTSTLGWYTVNLYEMDVTGYMYG